MTRLTSCSGTPSSPAASEDVALASDGGRQRVPGKGGMSGHRSYEVLPEV